MGSAETTSEPQATIERRLAIEIEEHRLAAHIARELRARQATIEKKRLGGRAGMTLAEVRAA